MSDQLYTNKKRIAESPLFDSENNFEFNELLGETSIDLCAPTDVMDLPLANKPSRQLRTVRNTVTPPFRHICKVFGANIDGDREEGTGFLISHKHVLTTAHILLDSSEKIVKPDQIEILPGINDGFIPFESSTAKKIIVFSGYVPGTAVCANDLAIIETEDFAYLNKPDSPPGFWGVSANGIDKKGTTFGAIHGWRAGHYKVNISGYPSNSEIQQHSFDHTIKIPKSKLLTLPTSKQEKILFIKNDVRRGMSGSPVWVKRHSSSGGRVAVAIFLGMDEVAGKRYAVARLITDDVIDFIFKNTRIMVRKANELPLFTRELSHNKPREILNLSHCVTEKPLIWSSVKTDSINLIDKTQYDCDNNFDKSENKINNERDFTYKDDEDGLELDIYRTTFREKFNIFSETEANYSSSATQQKVRWYQTILRIVVANPTVTLNGNHNHPATRKALRKLQEFYGLKPTSYLTVESNTALTQIALEWIYRFRIPNKIGKASQTLTNKVQQFQLDYKLNPDGKVGLQTREKMMDILLAKLPTQIKSFHSQLGSTNLSNNQKEIVDLNNWESITLSQAEDEIQYEKGPSGIHGRDNRSPVIFPANIPWRWICRIKIDGLWAGTGILISPRHVLTAGHIVYGDKNDSQGFRYNGLAKNLLISPAFDGHLLNRNRQFNKRAPFGTWKVDMDRIFLPPCYTYNMDISDRPPTNDDCDIAVLTLNNDIGTQKFTTKKTIRENNRKKHIFRDFEPLGYWGIDNQHQIVAYNPNATDTFSIFTGGYPASRKGIMQSTSGQVDNSYINYRLTSSQPRFKYSVNLYKNRFSHLLDTSPGQSGSPVWRKTISTQTIRKMIGVIHTINKNFNQGVGLKPQFLQQITDWAPETFKFDGHRLYVKKHSV